MPNIFDLEIPVEHFKKVCRVCLGYRKNLISIHETVFTYHHDSVGDIETLFLKEVLQRYCNILVHIDDCKPQNVCEACTNMLAKAFNILGLFQFSNIHLDKLLTKQGLKNARGSKPNECNITIPFEKSPCIEIGEQNNLTIEISSGLDADPEIKIEESQLDFENVISTEDNKNAILYPDVNLDPIINIATENNEAPSVISESEDGSNQVLENLVDMNFIILCKDELVLKDVEKHNEMLAQHILEKNQIVKQPDPDKNSWDHTYCIGTSKLFDSAGKHIQKSKVEQPQVTKLSTKKVKSDQQVKKKIQKSHHENDIFKCKLCEDLQFQGINKVIDHMKAIHPLTNECVLCGKKYNITKKLMGHVALHSKNGYLMCSKCLIYCKDRESLQDHYESEEHKNYTAKCNICSKEFRFECRLRLHVQEVHFNKGLLKTQCPKCGVVLKYRGSLSKHLLTHKEMKERRSFLCEQCAKTFTTSNDLKRHILIKHEGEMQLIESLRRYRRELAKKKRINSKPVPTKIYSCDYCPRTFDMKGPYFKHRISHAECKDITCPSCDKVLPDTAEYMKHRFSEHSTYQCDKCFKGWPTKQALAVHKHNTHRTRTCRFKCSYCPRKFPSRQAVTWHEYTHTKEKPFSCEFCGKTFTQRHHVDQHISWMHTKVRKHQCHICSKSFTYNYTLKAHIRYHMGCKPFNCPYCTKSFIDTIGRHKHVKHFHPEQMQDFIAFKKVYQRKEIGLVERLPANVSAQGGNKEGEKVKVVVKSNVVSSKKGIEAENYKRGLQKNAKTLFNDEQLSPEKGDHD